MKLNIDKDLQQKIILGVVLYAVGLVVFNNLVLSDLGKKTKMTRQELNLKKLEYSENLVKASSIDRIKKEIEKIRGEYADKRLKFIKENERKVLLTQIEEIGKKYGIKLETISLDTKTPQLPQSDTGAALDPQGNPSGMTGYKEYIITMNFKARYESLVYYIEEIEGLEKLIIVDALDISGGSGDANVRMILKAYIINDRGEQSGR